MQIGQIFLWFFWTFSDVIGARDLRARPKRWVWLIWTLLDEQWCERAFNLIFIHIWPCFLIYGALSNIQCRGEINGAQDMWCCCGPAMVWSPVTSFPAHIMYENKFSSPFFMCLLCSLEMRSSTFEQGKLFELKALNGSFFLKDEWWLTLFKVCVSSFLQGERKSVLVCWVTWRFGDLGPRNSMSLLR